LAENLPTDVRALLVRQLGLALAAQWRARHEPSNEHAGQDCGDDRTQVAEDTVQASLPTNSR
jgi:hypothetical protein